MSQLTVLRAVDYPRMPWKNGGGSTEEITRDAGVGLDGFGWRLSIADIAESGGFSSFNGYQRIITVLHGAGMTLQVDGSMTRPLRPFDPFAFSGESQVSCTLLDGDIRDFNLIYAPTRYSARLQWIDIQQPLRLFSSANTVLLFSAGEALSATVGERQTEVLGKHDCLHLEANQGLLEIVLQASAGRCCLIELTTIPA
ncbi:HutD family protein [Pseudomonas sp. NA-150]|uniref:HutD/Ves family protein n=1 Tax=Pseudomonas sp. NA-150 TaxID=3367525 RepID=UPI0037CAAC2D